MAGIVLRDVVLEDFARIVALNAAEVAQTSAMDAPRLQQLHAQACYHKVAQADGAVVAFLLAMDERADYDSDNFRWFAARYPHFVYVDRIVVNAAATGQGIGARLYRDLFLHARSRGVTTVVCEYNLDPPNPASQAFHQRFGFAEVGRQRLVTGKLVSMQKLELSLEAVQ